MPDNSDPANETMEHYRCFHCKKYFGPELAKQHFGDHTTDLPLCIQYTRNGIGGGPHDPYVRLLQSEYDRLKVIETATTGLTEIRALINTPQANTPAPAERDGTTNSKADPAVPKIDPESALEKAITASGLTPTEFAAKFNDLSVARARSSSGAKRRISGLHRSQSRGEFFLFELEDGGRVSIPPDQVMRLWNEAEDRK
jgi:hypothetical protein